jgi:hypothetical protein
LDGDQYVAVERQDVVEGLIGTDAAEMKACTGTMHGIGTITRAPQTRGKMVLSVVPTGYRIICFIKETQGMLDFAAEAPTRP